MAKRKARAKATATTATPAGATGPWQLAVSPLGWWEEAFAYKPGASEVAGHKCGAKQMLTIVAYDISDHKRLARVAKICEDYGVRVQYSVFECRMAADKFADFWLELEETIDPAKDRITAYKVCTQCAKSIYSAGTQTHMEDVVAYVF